MRESYPVNNEAEKEILFENGMEYVSLEEMLPAKHEELKASGYARMANFDSEYAVMLGDISVQQVKLILQNTTLAINIMFLRVVM